LNTNRTMKTLTTIALLNLWFVSSVETKGTRNKAVLVQGTDTSYLHTSKPIIQGDTINIENYLITR